MLLVHGKVTLKEKGYWGLLMASDPNKSKQKTLFTLLIPDMQLTAKAK